MTALCAIAGCRVRDRHRPGCDGEHCGGCLPRTTDDGYACDHCTARTRDRLAAIAAHAPDARLTAFGLVRRGAVSSGGNKPGSRPPLNDGVMDALDEVQMTLTTLARDIAEMRGLEIPGLARGKA